MKSRYSKKLVSFIKSTYNHTLGLLVNPILQVDWSRVKLSVYLRYLAMILLIANMLLTKAGCNPIPLTENDLYEIVMDILTAVMFLVNTYKNNSTSKEAIEADRILHELRLQSKAVEEMRETE